METIDNVGHDASRELCLPMPPTLHQTGYGVTSLDNKKT